MNVVTQLETMLDSEKEVLLSGNLDELENLLEQKESLKVRLEAGGLSIPQEQIQRIIEKSSRNQSLLKSAQRGIQAAVSQLREVSEGSFQSYSREGTRAPLASTRTFGKRI